MKDENVVSMFGIILFKTDGYCEITDDGTQYHALEWKLSDMKKFNGKYAMIGFDGSLKIYEDTGEELFNGEIIDSKDFRSKLKGIFRDFYEK